MILNALSFGDGAPVILLHGLFGAAKNLGALTRGLAATHRVIAMDMRNHGESPHADDMGYAAMAADVLQTAAALDVTAAVVVGHSMGGKTAMALALTQPEFVRRLAVLDIAPITYNHGYDGFIAAMRRVKLTPALSRHAADAALAAAVPEAPMRAFLLNNLVLNPEPHWRLGLAEISNAMNDLVGWTDPPGALAYQHPALFLRGGESAYVPMRAEVEIAARFPLAVIKTVAGTGHWLHAEKPQQVLAALEEFLADE